MGNLQERASAFPHGARQSPGSDLRETEEGGLVAAGEVLILAAAPRQEGEPTAGASCKCLIC